MTDEAREKQEYEVFLSHNNEDGTAIPLHLLAARMRS
jgi:hypothetical protein